MSERGDSGANTSAPRAGIYLAHKPAGATSFSLVQAFVEEVRSSGVRPDKLPACHGGALDPFAEGLLPILAGPATRLMELLHPIPKEYLAEVAWGAETDNGDLLGAVIAGADAGALDAARLNASRLDEALGAMVGWNNQIPPAHSNKRVGGERAYLLARRGEHVELPPSRVYLHAARWLEHDLPRASRLQLVCRGGYYVRALARDLGRALGARAHLRALSRAAIGPWRDPGPGARALIGGGALLPWLSSRALSDAEAARVLAAHSIARGELRAPDWPLPAGFPDPEGPIRALHGERLLALLREREGALHVEVRLRAGV